MESEKPLPIFLTILRGTRRLRRAILEDDFRLGEIAAQRLPGAKKNERVVAQAALHQEFGVRQ